ncbi:MAG: hypothetical protein C0596_03580 [Marinilabiliales bacterium]|nr:MAG: hypothetical protein C0596_03580 [Marinilabiliales bacterium]
MRKIYFSGLFIIIALFSFSQITITRSDTYDLGTEYPRIYFGFEQEGESYHVDTVITDPIVFDDLDSLDFSYVEIDTLIYQDPSETDTESYYEDATCAYQTREGYVMYLQITDEERKLMGFQGVLPMTGDPMNLKFTDTLITNTFPFVYEEQHQDIGSAFENQHISVFESIIPSEYYGTMTSLYDTVRFLMNLEIKVQYDQYGEMQCVGDSNLNGTFSYLRENNKLINIFDIQLRSKFSGTYTSLSDIPGIGDQLPMDLPMVDTTCTYTYWTNGLETTIAEIELNSAYDSVYNVTFRYAFLSSVPENFILNCEVYPNPATDRIVFTVEDFENTTLEIYTIDGKLLFSEELNTQNYNLNISAYKSGPYIYRLLNESKFPVSGGRFVKQ